MATSQTFPGFPPDTIKFLSALKKNNEREWFKERKDRYESAFLNPALEFIEAMQKPLNGVSPFLQAVPKKVGGSLMRIYKDTRFSKDKTPYKTNIGIHFRHEAGCNVHAPGCYVHIEPKSCFIGVGIWRPEKEPLALIRESIAEDPKAWKKVRDGKKFRETYELQGDSLKRPPAGFDKEHPMIDDLKRKDFIAVSNLKDDEITKPDFIKTVTARLKAGTPFMRFLCEAMELPY